MESEKTSGTSSKPRPPGKIGLPSFRSGLRTRLPLSELPKPFKHIRAMVNTMRSVIESEIVERHGSISVYHAMVINRLCECERMRQCCLRVLRMAGAPGQVTVATSTERVEGKEIEATKTITNGISYKLWLDYADRVTDYAEGRDKAAKDLGIHLPKDMDPWESIYEAQPAVLPQPAQECTQQPRSREIEASGGLPPASDPGSVLDANTEIQTQNG